VASGWPRGGRNPFPRFSAFSLSAFQLLPECGFWRLCRAIPHSALRIPHSPQGVHHKQPKYKLSLPPPSAWSGGTLDKPWTYPGTIDHPQSPIFKQASLSKSESASSASGSRPPGAASNSPASTTPSARATASSATRRSSPSPLNLGNAVEITQRRKGAKTQELRLLGTATCRVSDLDLSFPRRLTVPCAFASWRLCVNRPSENRCLPGRFEGGLMPGTGLLRPDLPRNRAASRALPGRLAAAARLRSWRWGKTARKQAMLAC
jgi:hypothetical protein